MPVSITTTFPLIRATTQTQATSIMLLPSAGRCFSHKTLGTTPNISPPSAFQWPAISRCSSRSPRRMAPNVAASRRSLREGSGRRVEYAAPMAVAAIRTSHLTKDYGAGRGLFDLDLEVAAQEVFGFLGPNGAGKTTAIRCVMGMIRPTSGSAHVFGLDCLRDSV